MLTSHRITSSFIPDVQRKKRNQRGVNTSMTQTHPEVDAVFHYSVLRSVQQNLQLPLLLKDVEAGQYACYLHELYSHLKFEYLKDSCLIPITNVGYFHLKGKDSEVVYLKKVYT